MSRSSLSQAQWRAYGLLRAYTSKETAEEYRHTKRQENKRKRPIKFREEPEIKWTTAIDSGLDGLAVKAFIAKKMNYKDRQKLMEEYTINYTPSPFDCTGQLFTMWFNFYEVPDGTWAYHFIGRDV